MSPFLSTWRPGRRSGDQRGGKTSETLKKGVTDYIPQHAKRRANMAEAQLE